MTTWGVTMMKDEEDVAYHTVMHMADEGFAGIIVADNRSSDGTRGCLERAAEDAIEVGCHVEIVDDDEPGYYQSKKMTELARLAGEKFEADWIVPFDADELWYTHGDRLALELDKLSDNTMIVQFRLWNHFATALDDEDEANPFRRMQWVHSEVGALPKVAVRWRDDLTIAQGNHSARYADGIIAYDIFSSTPFFELRHFPYRSYEQFRRKSMNGAQAYAATDLDEDAGAHWRQYGTILDKYGDRGLRDVYEEWFWFLAPVNSGMIHSPAPFRRFTEPPAA